MGASFKSKAMLLFSALSLAMFFSPVFCSGAEEDAQSVKESATISDTASKDDEGSVAAKKYISIPIFYMTDRKVDRHHNFGNDRKTESSSIYDVYSGMVDYTLYNADNKQLNANRSSLGWNEQNKSHKITQETLDLPEQPSDSLDKFGESIADFARRAGQKEIFLFVPGYNNTFDTSAKCAALLAYETERPVILYSWPSTAKFLQYFVDSGNNEWSQEHFNRLLETLCVLKDKYGLTVNVVAHSMGNRLVVRAAPIVEGKALFDQSFLVDPDLDSQTFLHYVSRYVHKKGANQCGGKLRILFSHRDNALPVAQMVFGGYTRLGQGADTIAESVFNPFPIFMREKSSLHLRAEDTSKSNDDIAHALFREELDWIDFTALDHGVIGHSIPYKLIANLSKTSTPGPGLAFEPVTVGVPEAKQGLGICRKIVFTDGDTVDAVIH